MRNHRTKETGIWVTFKDGVYDITSFVDSHPGGNRILQAAGGPIEPFWKMIPVHYDSNAKEILKQYKIGHLHEKDRLDPNKIKSEAYDNEPTRSPSLKVVSQEPFNAEPNPRDAMNDFYTPQHLMFVRNHHPSAIVDKKDYQLDFYNLTDSEDASLTLSFEELV